MRISYLLFFWSLFFFTMIKPSDSWPSQAIAQAETLSSYILETLHKLQESQLYWTQQLNPSWRAYINRSPNNWASGKPYRVKVQETINALKTMADWYATGLGMVDTSLRKIKNCTKSPQNFDQYNQLVIVVNHFSSHTLDITEPHINDQYSEQSIKQILIANEFHLREYKKHEQKQLTPYKPPCHLSRNWLSYSIAAAAIAGLLYYEHKNPGSFTNAYNYLCDGFKKYIHDPVANSLNKLFGPSDIQFASEEDVALSEQSFVEQYRILKEKEHRRKESWKDYLWRKVSSKDPAPISAEKTAQIEAEIAEALNGNKSKLEEGYIKQQEHTILNALTGDEINYLLVKGQAVILSMTRGAHAFENLLESNRFLFFLLSMIPVYFVGSTMYYSYEKLNKHYKNKNIYIPLRHAICMLHHILNTNSHSPTQHGHFVYWLAQLKEYSKYFNSSEYQLLMIDITHLESSHLNTSQKLNIIQRMFYTYGFLKAAPVLLETRQVTDLFSLPIESPMLA